MVACGLGCLSPASPAHGSIPGVAAPGYRRCWTRGGPAHTTRGRFRGAPQASVRFCFVLFSRAKTFKRRPCFHLRPRCVKPLAGVSGCGGRPRLPQTWPVPSVETRAHPPCPGRGSRAPPTRAPPEGGGPRPARPSPERVPPWLPRASRERPRPPRRQTARAPGRGLGARAEGQPCSRPRAVAGALRGPCVCCRSHQRFRGREERAGAGRRRGQEGRSPAPLRLRVQRVLQQQPALRRQVGARRARPPTGGGLFHRL